MNLNSIITTLSETYKTNPNTDLKTFVDYISSYTSSDYLSSVEFSEKNYNRVALYRQEEFEILLLCWSPKQASGFHKHSANGCIMKVLQGTIMEDRKHPNGNIETFQHDCSATIYMANEMGTHRVFNGSDSKVISLHIYAPSGFLG